VTDEKVEQAVLQYLTSENEDEYGRSRTLTTLFNKVIVPSIPHADGFDEDDELQLKNEFEAVLNQMVADDLLKSHWGERDVEHSYRLTDQGIYKTAGFEVLATETGEPIVTESGDFIEVGDTRAQPKRASAELLDTIDSDGWTGAKLVLTDAKIIRRIRVQANELRDLIHSTRFESNSDSQDLKALADALVAVCSMAEPELGIIERITAHPKFRYTAALTAAVATIRGALGI
jgi:hypothetical protein